MKKLIGVLLLIAMLAFGCESICDKIEGQHFNRETQQWEPLQ